MKRIIKFIWRFAKPYKWSFINAFLCIFFTSIVSMIYPLIFNFLVNEVFYNKNIKFFLIVIVLCAIIYFAEQSLHLILNMIWTYQFTTCLQEMRKIIYKKIVSLKYENLCNMSIGDMIGKINWQVDSFVELLHRNIAYFFASTFKLILLLIIVTLFDYRFCVLLVMYILLSYVTSYVNGIKIKRKEVKVKNCYIKFIGWIFEILENIKEIKFFNNTKLISNEYENYLTNINKKSAKVVMIKFFSDRLNNFIQTGIQILLYIISVLLFINDEISLGSFVALISYFEMSDGILNNINKYLGNIHVNLAHIESLIFLLESTDESDDNGKEISIKKGEIEFKKVDIYYGEKKILNQMSLKINPYESIAIVGRSGAGKSTITKILLRMIDVENGEVLIDNHKIDNISRKSIRRQIGIVQQEIFIFEETIRSNLLMANNQASESELWEALLRAGLKEYVENLEKGLDTVIGRDIDMSGGEKQRLMIARLFLKNPQILIFDEATASLDSETEFYINRAWKHLSRGKTTIIISHRLSTILNADKVAILDDGKIVVYDMSDILKRKSQQFNELFVDF